MNLKEKFIYVKSKREKHSTWGRGSLEHSFKPKTCIYKIIIKGSCFCLQKWSFMWMKIYSSSLASFLNSQTSAFYMEFCNPIMLSMNKFLGLTLYLHSRCSIICHYSHVLNFGLLVYRIDLPMALSPSKQSKSLRHK